MNDQLPAASGWEEHGHKPHFLAGNSITLLRNGTEYFPALEQALDEAQREVFLESYIFEHDQTGRRIAAALMRAARRGVLVHVLVDGFGSKNLSRQLIEEMLQAGVRLLKFRPEIGVFRIRRFRLHRMHRKLAVVDARLAFVGGINIIDDIDTPDQIPPRFDYAVAVQGPLLQPIRRAMQRLWARVAWTHFRQAWKHDAHIPVVAEPCGDRRAAFLVRDNIRHRRDIEEVYLRAIGAATSEIVIANAYFLPGINFRHALIDAAGRGVRVILLMQGRVEYVLLHYASRALYGSLIEAGVEIYEYHKGFMHAKVAVIDGHWATVGSSNIDPFSLLVSREANVVVENREFSGELRQSLELALQEGSRLIQPETWRQQSLLSRFSTWLSYGLVRFMMGMVGYARDSKERMERRQE